MTTNACLAQPTNLRSSIETTDEVRRYFVVGHIGRGSEIAELDEIQRFVDQDVVWFYVGMKDVATLEQRESEEKLMRVTAHRTDVDADIFAVFLQDFAQVHAGTREIRTLPGFECPANLTSDSRKQGRDDSEIRNGEAVE